MRVCIVTVAAAGIGGMQDHTRYLAAGLVQAGHEVDVIAPRPHEESDLAAFDGARSHWLSVPAAHPWLPRRHPLWWQASWEAFSRLQVERPFDVVHSESTSALELVRRHAHRTVPVVLKFHGNYLGEMRQALRRFSTGNRDGKLRAAKQMVWTTGLHLQRGEWHRFRPCEWMVTSEHEFRDAWRESFLVPARGHVVPNGIDADVFRPRDRAQVRAELGLADEPLLVCAGRLEPFKGTRFAIEALALLRHSARPPRLAIVGGGEEAADLRAAAAALGVADRVTFVASQPHAELARWLGAADVFLFTSRRNEGAPLVPLQAMASGTPVVSSDLGTVREMVGANGPPAGVFVPAADAGAIAAAASRLLTDEVFRQKLAANARRRVLGRYTVDRMIDATVAVYEVARTRQKVRA